MFKRLTANRGNASVNNVMQGETRVPVNIPMSSALVGDLVVPATQATTLAPMVHRQPLMADRYLYSYGKQTREWFPMIATGQVEYTKFEPYNGVMFNASFNDFLYQAGGFPQNTGTSFKVDTVAKSLKQGIGPSMGAQPQQTNSIFTRRAFSGAPSLPAKPTNQ